ncbi:MAG: porin [Flavobacteriales bacterium]|nr:MAG: porin [Flavobacteriales bacterium]
MKKVTKVLLATAFCAGVGLKAQKTPAPKFGKGLLNLEGKNKSWSMKVGTRMQFLSIADWAIDGNGDYQRGETSMLIRRARLKFDGHALTPKLKYKIELGLSNKDIGGANQYTNNAPRYILDAVLKWNFYKNFTLWAGQTKLPGNRERVISSGNLQFVDRSMLNKNFNIDRDLGFQLRHHFNLTENFVVREAFALSQGEGRNITAGNIGGHQYTARVELLPFGNFKSKGDYSASDLKREEKPKLSLGATYNFNDNAVKNKGSQGSYMENPNVEGGFDRADVETIFVDGMFKYQGFSAMGEYAKRNITDNSSAKVKTGNSTNLQAGYLFKNNWEVAGRYTNVKFDKDDFNTNYYTLGVSKYIVGHKLKVQSDIGYKDVTGSKKGELQYRLQFDIHF